jgi:hypothetical protein
MSLDLLETRASLPDVVGENIFFEADMKNYPQEDPDDPEDPEEWFTPIKRNAVR